MGRIGATELLLILAIALLLFGPSKLADMGKGLGEGLKNFKKGLSPDDEAKNPPPPAPPPPSPPTAQKTEPQPPPPEPPQPPGANKGT
jgi:sec-independent protein translocase protein TatA